MIIVTEIHKDIYAFDPVIQESKTQMAEGPDS